MDVPHQAEAGEGHPPPPPATDKFTALTEFGERLTKLVGLAALIYVVSMGLTYRWGSDWGRDVGQHVRVREGKPLLQAFPDDDTPTLPWKDDKLIQGGLTGIGAIGILCGYVVVMLLMSKRARGDRLSTSTAILMTFPNMMTAAIVVETVSRFRQDAGIRQWLVFAVSCAAAVATLVVVILIRLGKSEKPLRIQLGILAVQSLLTCYAMGATTGFISVDFEARYPLVEVLTTDDAKPMNGLRLLKTADTECRFAAVDGKQYLIPKEKIRYVRTVLAPALAPTLQSTASPAPATPPPTSSPQSPSAVQQHPTASSPTPAAPKP